MGNAGAAIASSASAPDLQSSDGRAEEDRLTNVSVPSLKPKKKTVNDLDNFEYLDFKHRREAYIETVSSKKTKTEILTWLRTLYDSYPKAYGDPAFMDEEDTDEGSSPFFSGGMLANMGVQRPNETQEEEGVVDEHIPGESIYGTSCLVHDRSQIGDGDSQAVFEDGQILQFMKELRPRQRSVFIKALKRMVTELRDDVQDEAAYLQKEHWDRNKNLQVISDSKNELRLANRKRVAFKKALNAGILDILRSAAREARTVHEPEEDEEQAASAARVHRMITKPNSGVDAAQVVTKIEAFNEHLYSSTLPVNLTRPLVRFWRS